MADGYQPEDGIVFNSNPPQGGSGIINTITDMPIITGMPLNILSFFVLEMKMVSH